MKKLFLSKMMIALSIVTITITSCKKEEITPTSNADNFGDESFSEENFSDEEIARVAFEVSNTNFYALANGLQLDLLNSNSVNGSATPISSATITGLQPSETILAIDFRPGTGQLYGLGSSSRLYVINPTTGVARMIGPGALPPLLSGTIAGFDFNPTVDRIRVVTSSGQNLRLNPETGTIAATDVAINGQAGSAVSAVAYTNNRAGATATVLYDIDPVSDRLFRQDPPNNGTLVSVGALNLNVEGEGGFDISPKGEPVGIFKVNNVSTLFTVNLTSGRAKVQASFPNTNYTAIAIPTASVAYTVNGLNRLLIFDVQNSTANATGFPIVSKPLTGLPAGVSIQGLDMRPLNGQLYALGSNSGIYTINTANGAATLAFTLSTPLSGTHFGFDFNPVVDRIRIVSNTGQNLRFNPNDGVVLVDGSLNPGTPAVSAAAYTNNFAGTTSTLLLGIDVNTDQLFQVVPPNSGALVLVGSLGVDAQSLSGYDIGGASNVGYAMFKIGNDTKIYSINTSTGQATQTGNLGNNNIRGLALGLGF